MFFTPRSHLLFGFRFLGLPFTHTDPHVNGMTRGFWMSRVGSNSVTQRSPINEQKFSFLEANSLHPFNLLNRKITPPETNMAPENRPLEMEIPYWKPSFNWGSMEFVLVFGDVC